MAWTWVSVRSYAFRPQMLGFCRLNMHERAVGSRTVLVSSVNGEWKKKRRGHPVTPNLLLLVSSLLEHRRQITITTVNMALITNYGLVFNVHHVVEKFYPLLIYYKNIG